MDESSPAYQAGYEAGYAIGGIASCLLMILIPVVFIVALILAIVKKSKAWTIVTVISGLLGLGLIAVIAVFALKEAKEVVEETEEIFEMAAEAEGVETTTTRAEGAIFTLDLPDNWSQQPLGSADATLQVGNLAREEYLLVIHEPISDFDEGFTIMDFADLASGGVTSALSDSSRGELTPLEINGMPAIQCRIEGSADGVRIAYLNSYIQGENDFYQVMTWTLPSKEDVAFPIFRETMATFQEGGAEAEPAPTEE